MTVNILGTEYTIEVKKRKEDKRLNTMDGLCDDSVKEIILARFKESAESKLDLKAVQRKVLRHEIVHAFFCESGLAENTDWAQNEEMVDWIAIQGPKIYKAWQEANALDVPQMEEVIDENGEHTGTWVKRNA